MSRTLFVVGTHRFVDGNPVDVTAGPWAWQSEHLTKTLISMLCDDICHDRAVFVLLQNGHGIGFRSEMSGSNNGFGMSCPQNRGEFVVAADDVGQPFADGVFRGGLGFVE